jgi:hypothetical protein
MTENMLLKKAKELLAKEKLYLNSLALYQKIKTENGVESAMELIEKNFR